MGGQQGVAGDERGHDVLALIAGDPLVVVGQGPEVLLGDQPVQGAGGARRALQLAGGALAGNAELGLELGELHFDFPAGELVPVALQQVDLQQLEVTAEDPGQAGEVRIDVQHPLVVVAEYPDPRIAERGANPHGIDPGGDLLPGVLLLQPTRYQIIFNLTIVENIGDLRRAAGLAVGQPLSGHHPAVTQGVEALVVDGRDRLEIEHDEGQAGTLGHGQDGAGEGVGGDVQEDRLHAFAQEALRRRAGRLGAVHQAGIHHLHPQGGKPSGDVVLVAGEAFLQSRELRPVGIQADAEQADPAVLVHSAPPTIIHIPCVDGPSTSAYYAPR